MNPIRRAAAEKLSGIRGAFLRCDRGNALYVTNAPVMIDEKIDWDAAGFFAREEGKLCFLVPGEGWIGSFEEWARGQVQCARLSKAVCNASFGAVEPEDMRLFAEGIKRFEMKGDAAGYERLVRQRAAVCLRERSGGGTLVACALIVDMMTEGGTGNEA